MRQSPVQAEASLLRPSIHGCDQPALEHTAASEPTQRITSQDHSLLLDAGESGEATPLAVRDIVKVSRLKRTPVWGAAVNSIAFMAVPRTVPACFAATGWPLGVACLLYSSAVTYDTGLLLGDVCNECARRIATILRHVRLLLTTTPVETRGQAAR